MGWLLAGGCDSGGPAPPATCTSDRQCSGAGLVCDFARGTCVQCTSATDCSANQACRAGACVDVVACMSSRACPGQVCDQTLGYCVDCVADVDCDSSQTCRDGVCVTPPPSCTSDRACTGMGLVCDIATATCVECNSAVDCATGRTCSSSHTCVVGTDRDASVVPDASIPRDAGPPFVIAPHGAQPVVSNQGGPRLSSPQMVVLTYDDDPYRSTLEANAQWLVGSTWLTMVGAEYGIGLGSVIGTVHLGASPSAITDVEIESLLSSGIASHAYPRAADGSVDNGVIYFIYFPARTVVTTVSDGSQSCTDFGGFHASATTLGGETYSYAVIDACTSSDHSLTAIESEEITVSHELIEAATDPLPGVSPTFEMPRSSLSPWLLVGAELADLCELNAGPSSYVRYPPYVATRVWSNARASTNDRDPCAPSTSSAPYYSVSVTPTTLQPISSGGTVTFDLAGWSTGLVSNWRVDAMASGTMFTPVLSIDRPSMNNGDHATLTVRAPTGLASNDYALIWLYVSMPGDTSSYDTIPIGVYVP